jgi:uncharacterized membrane protein YedE/YeeE
MMMVPMVLLAALAGALFGLGLVVAGMANPAKVQAFLDLAGAWDPSLALVMVGAISVAALAFVLGKRRGKTWLGAPLHLPSSAGLDKRLLVGSLLFGIGWGLAGICPGPALVLLGGGSAKALGFFAAMLAGMLAHRLLSESRA